MQKLIRRLGKPRSFLVLAAASISCVLLGGLCVALSFLGLQFAVQLGSWVIFTCWAIGGLACVTYFAGQFSGRYRDLQGKSWAELPW